jgi:hypothetical protein
VLGGVLRGSGAAAPVIPANIILEFVYIFGATTPAAMLVSLTTTATSEAHATVPIIRDDTISSKEANSNELRRPLSFIKANALTNETQLSVLIQKSSSSYPASSPP